MTTKQTAKALLARDIMTREICTVRPDASLQDIARLLVDRHISALPVTDEDDRIVGIVSESDLLRRGETGTERRRSWWLELFVSPDTLAREYVKAHGVRAIDVMTSHVHCVRESASLAEIADLMEAEHVKRVPVVRAGRLIGIVSRADLVRALLSSAADEETRRETIDDRRIRAKLKARLRAAPWSRKAPLNTTVSQGTIQLSGYFLSDDHRKALRVLAETIPGVNRVDDNLALWPYASWEVDKLALD
jgi:CBS domain-containing protein